MMSNSQSVRIKTVDIIVYKLSGIVDIIVDRNALE